MRRLIRPKNTLDNTLDNAMTAQEMLYPAIWAVEAVGCRINLANGVPKLVGDTSRVPVNARAYLREHKADLIAYLQLCDKVRPTDQLTAVFASKSLDLIYWSTNTVDGVFWLGTTPYWLVTPAVWVWFDTAVKKMAEQPDVSPLDLLEAKRSVEYLWLNIVDYYPPHVIALAKLYPKSPLPTPPSLAMFDDEPPHTIEVKSHATPAEDSQEISESI